MGHYFILQAFFTMMLSGFSGGDALDFMTTDGYWNAKNMTVTVEELIELAKAPPEGDVAGLIKDLGSSDFKVREAARERIEAMGSAALPQLRHNQKIRNEQAAEAVGELIKKLKGHEKSREIERLMAIRTLGEKREKKAIAVLEEDLKSKQMFVADYAARALALIQNKPIPPREDIKIAGDALLLPDDVAMLVQVRPWAMGKQPNIEAMVDVSVPRRTEAGLENDGGTARKAEAYKVALDIVERIGNVRPEGITVEFSSEFGSGKGWVAVVVRALYDREALTEMFVEKYSATLNANEKDYPEINLEDKVIMILPKPDMAILVLGQRDGIAADAIKEIKESLKTGKSKIAAGAFKDKITDLSEHGGRAWGIMDPKTDPLVLLQKKPTWLKTFSSITLTSKMDPQTKTTSFEVTCEGTEAQDIKKAAGEVEEWIKQSNKSFESMKDDARKPKAAVEFFNSLKVEADGKKAKLTGTLPENIGELVAVFIWGAAF